MQKRMGNVVWITGASKGIGRALALEFLSHGYTCALTARDQAALEAVKQMSETLSGSAHIYPGDVTDKQGMTTIAEKIESDIDAISLLIANAGTHIPSDPLHFNSGDYTFLMQTNYVGMLHCIEAVLPGMLKRGAGHISAVSSLAGYRGLPTSAAYGASKAAMTSFLESIRFHLEHQDIQVSIISPGFVKTPLTDKNDFYMPFLIEPEKAARTVFKGLERKKKEISFPIPFNWMLALARIIPYPLYEFLIRRVWHP